MHLTMENKGLHTALIELARFSCSHTIETFAHWPVTQFKGMLSRGSLCLSVYLRIAVIPLIYVCLFSELGYKQVFLSSLGHSPLAHKPLSLTSILAQVLCLTLCSPVQNPLRDWIYWLIPSEVKEMVDNQLHLCHNELPTTETRQQLLCHHPLLTSGLVACPSVRLANKSVSLSILP